MTNHESNTVNMFDTVIGVYIHNQTTFADYPAIIECNEELTAYVREIKDVDKEYEQATSGKTAEKNSALEEAAKTALPIKAALYAYASKNKLEDLKAKSTFTESDIKKLNAPEMIKLSKTLVQEARTILTNLSGYKITEEKLAAFETKTNALETKSTNKGSSFTSKSALRKTLTEKFKAANSLLNEQYDELMETVREDNPELYNQYWSARVIKDLGGAHTKEEENSDQANTTTTPTA